MTKEIRFLFGLVFTCLLFLRPTRNQGHNAGAAEVGLHGLRRLVCDRLFLIPQTISSRSLSAADRSRAASNRSKAGMHCSSAALAAIDLP
jgi:hypothetical protein